MASSLNPGGASGLAMLPQTRGALHQSHGRTDQVQLTAKLDELARNPDKVSGVKPMAGEWAGFFPLRHGDLRVIYTHDRVSDSIVVAHVGPRGDVYK